MELSQSLSLLSLQLIEYIPALILVFVILTASIFSRSVNPCSTFFLWFHILLLMTVLPIL